MRYVRSFMFSEKLMQNPNIYPYNQLRSKTGEVLIFDDITILYGENGAGKSTILNLLASTLAIPGAEYSQTVSQYDYFADYLAECRIGFEHDESHLNANNLPENRRFIKSEDILYEVKKIQQKEILQKSVLFEQATTSKNSAVIETLSNSFGIEKQVGKIQFGQEKYSNGETAMTILEDKLLPDGFYLLDEPEVSLSPLNQLRLAEFLNEEVRFHGSQFVIATHSPFLLGNLVGTIYQLDLPGVKVKEWQDLPNMKIYQQFFDKKKAAFN
ncbi:AAA family ATPase [Listeria ilorinensis]|uniref:AAA family ATPase n=1 Tax=Listeria ilorinensis TaxID=2867439 RepID=UPI001EF4BCA1|nr:AAA family ATPase [Listeria ilorinensis]